MVVTTSVQIRPVVNFSLRWVPSQRRCVQHQAAVESDHVQSLFLRSVTLLPDEVSRSLPGSHYEVHDVSLPGPSFWTVTSLVLMGSNYFYILMENFSKLVHKVLADSVPLLVNLGCHADWKRPVAPECVQEGFPREGQHIRELLSGEDLECGQHHPVGQTSDRTGKLF